MTEFGRYSPSISVAHRGHLVRCHQGTAPRVDRPFAGTTLPAKISFELDSVHRKCFAISTANRCKRVGCRPVIASRRWKQQSNSIRSGESRHCSVHSRQWLPLFHRDVFWEHVVLVKDADHDVQELGGVVC